MLRRFAELDPGYSVALIAAAIWLTFWPSIVNYESYLYAAGIEGIVNVAGLYNVFQADLQMPDFSLYHPNHLLPHTLVWLLWKLSAAAGCNISALAIFRSLNFVSSVAAACLYFSIGRVALKDTILAFVFALLLSFTSIQWFSAVNGESHMTGNFFMLLSFRFMLGDEGPEPERRSWTLKKAALFSLGFLFHFGTAIFCVVIIAFYLRKAYVTRNPRHIVSLVLFGGFCAFVFFIFYALIFRIVYSVESWSEWWRIFTMHTYIPMGGTTAPGISGIANAVANFFAIITEGYFPGAGVGSVFLGRFFFTAAALSLIYLALKKRGDGVTPLIVSWITLPICFLFFVMRAPNNMGYAMLLLVPTFLACFLAGSQFFSPFVARLAGCIWLAAAFSLTLTEAILPKFRLAEDNVYFAARLPAGSIDEEMIVLVWNYYGILPDTYYLGHYLGKKPRELYYQYDANLRARLGAQLQNRATLLIATDNLHPRAEAMLRSLGYGIETVFGHETAHDRRMYWFSAPPPAEIGKTFNRSFRLLRLRHQAH